MKNNKKIILLLVGILICLLLFSIIQVYAKYLTSATGKTSIQIAKWDISVNKNSIKNSSDISASVEPVFSGNDNMSADIIAPTAEGYFDLELDYTNVDVAFQYVITVKADENSSVQDLVSTGYSIDGGNKVTFADYNQSITSIVNLSDTPRTRKIRVYILWNDDDSTQDMTDEDDTNTTKDGTNPALLFVNVAFTQVAE